MEQSRRRFLAAAGALSVSALAGCLGGGNGGSVPADGSPSATPGDDRDVMHLQTLQVGGSPGGEISLQPPDRVTLLDFFATWCGPCRPQMANLGEVRKTFSEEELHMVSITSETDEKAIKKFWTEYKGTWPVALDPGSDANIKYSVKGIPTLIILFPDGTEHWRHRGLAGVDNVTKEVESALEEYE